VTFVRGQKTFAVAPKAIANVFLRKPEIESKNDTRTALTELLREACRLVNFDANGDRPKLLTSGFAIYELD